MINIQDYIKSFLSHFPENSNQQPWEIVDNLEEILTNKIQQLSDDYRIEGNVAIHKSATVEKGVTLKGTIIISHDKNVVEKCNHVLFIDNSNVIYDTHSNLLNNPNYSKLIDVDDNVILEED